MQNSCINKLRILGSEEDIQAFINKAAGQSPWPLNNKENLLNFHNLVPVPKEVLKAGYDCAGAQWECDNWGCKSGATETKIIEEGDGGKVVYQFLTPWSPPIEFLEGAAEQFPSLTFLLDYEAEGAGFKGIAGFKGESKEDHCIDYGAYEANSFVPRSSLLCADEA